MAHAGCQSDFQSLNLNNVIIRVRQRQQGPHSSLSVYPSDIKILSYSFVSHQGKNLQQLLEFYQIK